MTSIILRIFKTIHAIFGSIRGEVKSPEKITADKDKRLFDQRRSFVKADEVNIDGKTFQVYSIFDRASKQTAADKIKYLIDSDAKN